mgnify:CR=1 FL=1
MPFYQDTDRQRMLDEFGVPVTVAGVTAKCLVNDSDEEIAAGVSSVLVGRAIIARCATGAFAGLVQGAAATADYPTAGTAYKIVSVKRDRPGDFTSIVLAKV